jgi:hypothetical protein
LGLRRASTEKFRSARSRARLSSRSPQDLVQVASAEEQVASVGHHCSLELHAADCQSLIGPNLVLVQLACWRTPSPPRRAEGLSRSTQVDSRLRNGVSSPVGPRAPAIYNLHKTRDAEQTRYIRTSEMIHRPTSCSSPYTRVSTLLETRTCKVPDSYAELCTRCNKQGNLAEMEATLNRPTVYSDLTDSGV